MGGAAGQTGDRQPGGDPEAARVGGSRDEVAAGDGDPFAQPGQPVAGGQATQSRGAWSGDPRPSSSTATVTFSAPHSIDTVACAPAPRCLLTLVSASWTSRYAARSMLASSRRGSR